MSDSKSLRIINSISKCFKSGLCKVGTGMPWLQGNPVPPNSVALTDKPYLTLWRPSQQLIEKPVNQKAYVAHVCTTTATHLTLILWLWLFVSMQDFKVFANVNPSSISLWSSQGTWWDQAHWLATKQRSTAKSALRLQGETSRSKHGRNRRWYRHLAGDIGCVRGK